MGTTLVLSTDEQWNDCVQHIIERQNLSEENINLKIDMKRLAQAKDCSIVDTALHEAKHTGKQLSNELADSKKLIDTLQAELATAHKKAESLTLELAKAQKESKAYRELFEDLRNAHRVLMKKSDADASKCKKNILQLERARENDERNFKEKLSSCKTDTTDAGKSLELTQQFLKRADQRRDEITVEFAIHKHECTRELGFKDGALKKAVEEAQALHTALAKHD